MKTIKNQIIDMLAENGRLEILNRMEKHLQIIEFNEIIETYLNGNITDTALRFKALKSNVIKQDFIDHLKADPDTPDEKKIKLLGFLLKYEYR